MKNTAILLFLGLMAALPAAAQDNKPQDKNKWNISKLDVSKLPAPAATTGVVYTKDIKPLFEASCDRCHGEDQQKGGLRLDSLEATLKGGKAGKIVTVGDSTKSLLVLAVCQQDAATAMPPKRRPGGGGPGGPNGGPGNAPGGAGRGPGGPDGQGVPGPGGQVGKPAEGPGGPGGPGGRGGPPAKPFTTDQVALIRAWIDQGAK